MKHGKKLIQLSGDPSHRTAKLRNLVSALLHHEMIKTTLPRARAAARMAEKMITLGKKNTRSSMSIAESFILPPHNDGTKDRDEILKPQPIAPLGYPGIPQNVSAEDFEPPKTLLPKLFVTLRERYMDRPGGYTRIHSFGRRKGDNAPAAILTLVDGPRDLKYEMLARTIGKEISLEQNLRDGEVITGDLDGWLQVLDKRLKEEVESCLKFRSDYDKEKFADKVRDFADRVAVEKEVADGWHRPNPEISSRPEDERTRLPKQYIGVRPRAGERTSGMIPALTGLNIARGLLGQRGRNTNERNPKTGKFRRVQQDEWDKSPRFLQDTVLAAGEAKPASASGL